MQGQLAKVEELRRTYMKARRHAEELRAQLDAEVLTLQAVCTHSDCAVYFTGDYHKKEREFCCMVCGLCNNAPLTKL